MAWFRKAPNDGEAAAPDPAQPQCNLALFGKHPAWEDHVPPFGLGTAPLVKVKELLYEGFRRNIDGDHGWKKVAAEQAENLIQCKHSFVWRRNGQWFFGRFWHSSDGKGRSDYPFIVCCEFMGPDGVAMVRRALPRLEALEQKCKETKAADDIASAHREFAATMARLADPALPALPSQTTDDSIVERLKGGLSDEPLLRALYRIETQMTAFDARTAGRGSGAPAPQPQQIRLPGLPDNILDGLLFWFRLFAAFTAPGTPILVMAPSGEPWVDVVLGEPAEAELFSIRAGTKIMPPASEVPYKLDDEFRQRARDWLSNFLTTGGAIAGVAGSAGDAEGGTVRWFKSRMFSKKE